MRTCTMCAVLSWPPVMVVNPTDVPGMLHGHLATSYTHAAWSKHRNHGDSPSKPRN